MFHPLRSSFLVGVSTSHGVRGRCTTPLRSSFLVGVSTSHRVRGRCTTPLRSSFLVGVSTSHGVRGRCTTPLRSSFLVVVRGQGWGGAPPPEVIVPSGGEYKSWVRGRDRGGAPLPPPPRSSFLVGVSTSHWVRGRCTPPPPPHKVIIPGWSERAGLGGYTTTLK